MSWALTRKLPPLRSLLDVSPLHPGAAGIVKEHRADVTDLV